MIMFVPEEIDIDTLPWLDFGERRRLPSIQCVYMVLEGQTVLYVGRTTNLLQRWSAHHRLEQILKAEKPRIAWIEVAELNSLPAIEMAVIHRLQPILNSTYTTLDRSSGIVQSPGTRMYIHLGELRKLRGLTQEELAKRTEMTLGNIQRIEYGKTRSVCFKTFDNLCHVLQCEVGDLIKQVIY